jgi:hypothetical protein
MAKGTYQFKDMAAGVQEELAMPELLERLVALHVAPVGE